MKNIIVHLSQLLVALSLSGCTGVEFQGILAGQYQLETNAFFPMQTSEINFKQVSSFKNQMSLQLNLTQIGQDLSNIDRSMIQLTHQNVSINNFTLENTSVQKDNIIDIAFVIDVTGTMSTFIEDAKARIINFIQTSMNKGIRTRMCISTFGDYTVKKCDRFFDNDPANKDSISQTQELISLITSLRAFKGKGQDPGWPEYDENPMQAIIDVAKAPFRPEAQKFVIMVTDAGFLYSPQNPGTLGIKAPNLNAVAQAIRDSQITIFGITPFLPGYTSELNGLPSIIAQSRGEHYLFASVINGEVTLNQILDRVLDRVRSTYILTYNIDDYPQLNPSSPVDYKQIEVKINDPKAEVKLEDLKMQASFPNGRPEFIQNWNLSNESINSSSVKVWVNQKPLNKDQFEIKSSNLRLKQPPALGANILVKYLYEDKNKNIRSFPIFLNRAVVAEELMITINGIQARTGDVNFERDLNQDLSIMILPQALQDDHYQVEKFQGLYVDIK